MHDNKFCLHVCHHLKGGRRGRSVPPGDLGERSICITFGVKERAENDLFGVVLSLLFQTQLTSQPFIPDILFLKGLSLGPPPFYFFFSFFRNKLVNSYDFRCRVNLLYANSRGHFLFLNLPICGDKSDMKFTFCAI